MTYAGKRAKLTPFRLWPRRLPRHGHLGCGLSVAAAQRHALQFLRSSFCDCLPIIASRITHRVYRFGEQPPNLYSPGPH